MEQPKVCKTKKKQKKQIHNETFLKIKLRDHHILNLHSQQRGATTKKEQY